MRVCCVVRESLSFLVQGLTIDNKCRLDLDTSSWRGGAGLDGVRPLPPHSQGQILNFILFYLIYMISLLQ